MSRILVVDPEFQNSSPANHMLSDCHNVTCVATIAEGLNAAADVQFHLILTELNLPDGHGFELIDRIRLDPKIAETAFIIVTNDQEINAKLTAFSMGAEDYLTKPIDPRELHARVDLRLRRIDPVDSPLQSQKKIRLDQEALRVWMCDMNSERDIGLTPNEYRVLQVFEKNPGIIMKRSDILRIGWGSGIKVLDRTIDRHIVGLRRKLGLYGRRIEAVPKLGYRWVTQDSVTP